VGRPRPGRGVGEAIHAVPVTMKRLSRRRQNQTISGNPLHVGMMFREDALGTIWPLV
jgi:hypothetical protein